MISFDKNTLHINDTKIEFDFPIDEIGNVDDIVIVRLNLDSNTKHWGQIPSLFGVSQEGNILWKAELPTTASETSYVSMKIDEGKLTAYTWTSYDCYIDHKTGKIKRSVFMK